MDALRAEIQRVCKRELQHYWCPGRIEVVGKHTDYAKGRSVVCAIDKGLLFGFADSNTDLVTITSCNFPDQTLQFDLKDLHASIEVSKSGFGLYACNVLSFLNESIILKGMDIIISSSLPPDAGLSSSSALVCGLATILSRHQDNFSLSIDDFGRMESGKFVATRGGSQDHAAIMSSKPGALCLFEYKNGTVLKEMIAFPTELLFVVIVSGVVACKSGNALELYNALASAEVKEHRAIHESDFVVPGVAQALKTRNWHALKSFVDESQLHAERVLLTTTPETKWLVDESIKLGSLAASVFGAGFGGSVYAIVENLNAETFMENIMKSYYAAFSNVASERCCFSTFPSTGAMYIN